MSEQERIAGGAFQIARKLFESELWLYKPSSWKIIWIYILGRVSHKKNGNCERGEGYFQWKKEINLIGNDIKINSIKRFSQYAVASSMISTRRSTRGVYIKVLNYNVYQDLDNYSSTRETTTNELEKHQRSTPIDKNGRMEEVKNNTILATDVAEPVKIKFNVLGADVIKAFEAVDPKNKTYYGNKTQRTACDYLLNQYGLEEVLKRIQVLPRTNKIPFFPKINSPNDLKEKWVKLQDAVDAKREEFKSKKPIII